MRDGMPGGKCKRHSIRLVNKFGKSLAFMQRTFHPEYIYFVCLFVCLFMH